MPPERLIPWIALSLLPGVGPITARRAVEIHRDPDEVAFRLPAAAWREVPGIDREAIDGIVTSRPSLARRVEAEWDAAVRLNVRIVTRDEAAYPSLLAALPDAPCVLYLRGSLADPCVRVAIVGSRRATAYGRSTAQTLSADLAELGVEIVSGGARGIDSCAHRGALDAGGRTVAVLGSGLGRTYPPENAPLFDRIERAGALLSEFPVAMPPLAGNFPRRNRLISALSAAAIVVEATEKSGSLITAAHALEQGREVMAVPGPVTSEQSRGCHRLIQQGAKLVQRVEDVLDELSPMYRRALGEPGSPPTSAAPAADLPPDERTVLSLFDDPRPLHVDRLAEAAPFGIARLQAALFALSLRGCIDPLAGGYYVARSRTGSSGS